MCKKTRTQLTESKTLHAVIFITDTEYQGDIINDAGFARWEGQNKRRDSENIIEPTVSQGRNVIVFYRPRPSMPYKAKGIIDTSSFVKLRKQNDIDGLPSLYEFKLTQQNMPCERNFEYGASDYQNQMLERLGYSKPGGAKGIYHITRTSSRDDSSIGSPR